MVFGFTYVPQIIVWNFSSGSLPLFLNIDFSEGSYYSKIFNTMLLWNTNKIYTEKTVQTASLLLWPISEPIFMESSRGRPVIQIGRYRFNLWSGSRGPRARWICTKVHAGCSATLITLDNVIVKQKAHNHWDHLML